jgi:hypothetical protein
MTFSYQNIPYRSICFHVHDTGRLISSPFLCDCEAVAHIRFRNMGQFLIEPSDYYDAPIDKVLYFIRGVG